VTGVQTCALPILGPTAGEEKGTTKFGPSAIARDGVEGKASSKRGYQADAHSGLHHGKNGEAVGHRGDLHMNFDDQLYSEGRGLSDSNPGHVEGYGARTATSSQHGKASGKADHHPRMPGTTHKFEQMPASSSHGYGHTGSSQCDGHLRLSGHSKSHQVGKR